MEQRAQPECAERDPEKAFAAAQNGEDGVDQAEGIKSGGHTKPENAGFAHDVRKVSLQYKWDNGINSVTRFHRPEFRLPRHPGGWGRARSATRRARGMVQAETRDTAELVILNTCTVTAEADSDARAAIRRVHRENPAARILVTGCYAQRAPEELAAMPGVEWVVGNSHKTHIAETGWRRRAVSRPNPDRRYLRDAAKS